MEERKKTNAEKKKKNTENEEKKKSNKNKVLKRKKSDPSIAKHNIEEHLNDIMYDIEENEDIVEQVVKHIKFVKISIEGKKLPKNIPLVLLDNVTFHSKESVAK